MVDGYVPAYFEIDKLTFEMLTLLAEGIREKAVCARLRDAWGEEPVDRAFDSFAALKEQGFFVRRGAPPAMGGARTIEGLVRAQTDKVQLALAESCNLGCKYCYVHRESKWRRRNERIMPWEIARKAVDFLIRRAGRNASGYSITFFGGEPLLNKHVLHNVVAYTDARKKELGLTKPTFYSLTTNGTLMSLDVIRQIKRHNFGIMVSMDGPPDVHDGVRVFLNHRGSWAATARGARYLMQYRRQVSVRCTITNRCLEKARIVRYLEDFGFYRIRLSVAMGQAYRKGPFDVGPEELKALETEDEILEELYVESIRSGDWDNHRFARYRQLLMDMREPQRQTMRCGAGRGTTIVDIKGDLYPCHRYLGMEAYRLGNVDTGVDPELFAAYLEKFFVLRQRLCADCWANTLCLGPCLYYVSHPSGEMVDPEPWYCDMIRRGIENSAAFHSRIRRDFPDYYEHVVRRHEEMKNSVAARNARRDREIPGHPNSNREIPDQTSGPVTYPLPLTPLEQ